MDDQKILELFFERNETAIVEAKGKYGGRLFKTALNILKNKEDAEECVNDALFKAWKSIPPVYPDMLGAFLAKIVRNTALHKWQANRAAKRGGGEVNLLLSEFKECILSTTPQNEPEGKLVANLVTSTINTWLATLEKTSKAVFILRYFHGESIRDISERFKISESKVKSTLFRARKKLGATLEKEGIFT